MVKLLAPDTYWQIPDNERGGCGPGEWGDKFVPDSLLWCDIRPACSIHDHMWDLARAGEGLDYKYHGDFVFLINMRKLINHQKPHTPGWMTTARLWMADYYFDKVWWWIPTDLRRTKWTFGTKL